MNEPLKPFSSPFALAARYGITTHELVAALFVLVLLFWAIFTLVAIYHWVRYSHAALLAIPSIFIHLIVSAILIVFTLTALSAI